MTIQEKKEFEDLKKGNDNLYKENVKSLNQIKELKKLAEINESAIRTLESVNEALKQSNSNTKSALLAIEEKLLQAEEHIKDITIDFEDSLVSGKKLSAMMEGKSWPKVITFLKDLNANTYRNLEKTVAKQKNDYLCNTKQLDNLKRICTDIAEDTVSFNP